MTMMSMITMIRTAGHGFGAEASVFVPVDEPVVELLGVTLVSGLSDYFTHAARLVLVHLNKAAPVETNCNSSTIPAATTTTTATVLVDASVVAVAVIITVAQTSMQVNYNLSDEILRNRQLVGITLH